VAIHFLYIVNKQNRNDVKIAGSSTYFCKYKGIVQLLMTRQWRVVRLKTLESFMNPAFGCHSITKYHAIIKPLGQKQ